MISMVAMAGVMINECLFFNNNVAKRECKSVLVTTLSSFYHDDELYEAKTELCKVASANSSPIDGWGKLVNKNGGAINRKADSAALKRCAEADDLVSMYSLLDVNNVMMPTWVAAKLDRIPIMAWPNVAPVTDEIIRRLDALDKKLSSQPVDVMARVEAKLPPVGDSVMPIPAVGPSSKVKGKSGVTSDGVTAGGAVVPQPSSGPSWADLAVSLSTAAQPFTNVVKPKASVRATGSKAHGCTIKTFPRQLVCFVGRLDSATTEAELVDYLNNVGIHGVSVKKLSAKDGRTFKTAAFRVACEYRFKDLFYDQDIWPAGCELRDWIFYPKNGGE